MADKFEQWGVVEIMGHQRAAGRLTEEVVAGANLLRVDAPINAHDFRTVYYGAAAIYALHVTGEEEARKMAARSGARPPFAYELEQPAPRTALERFSTGGGEDDQEF